MTKFKILYSLELEKERVKFYEKYKERYDEMDYSLNMPERPIEEQYAWSEKHRHYKKKAELIQQRIPEIEDFLKKLSKEPDTKLQKEYVIRLTKYGTSGSYWLPNIVVISILSLIDPIENIKHEITHLAVEHIVQEKKLNHEENEKLVDKLMEKVEST